MPSSLSWRRIGVSLAWAYAAATAVTTVIGCVRSYSPVPTYDMWEGFYSQFLLAPPGWARWWRQYNEHRIVLARLLFWLDWNLAGGRGILLAAANLALAAAGAVLLLAFLKARASEAGLEGRAEGRPVLPLCAALVVTLSLSWLQESNLVWQFQSQFFLAQSLPFFGAYCLYRCARDRASSGWFAAACVSGALSVGSMANGVLALPVLAALAAWLGLGRGRVALLASLGAAGLSAYAWGYRSPAEFSAPLARFAAHPLDWAAYLCAWLGGPAQAWLPESMPRAREALALSAGVLFLGLAATLARSGPRAGAGPGPVQKALAAFLGYVLLSAGLTATGRLGFGMGHALSSRYETPALAAWCSLLLLGLPWASALLARRPRAVSGLAVAGALALALNAQAHVWDGQGWTRFNQNRAMLALSLGAPDPKAVDAVFFYHRSGLAQAVARALRRSGKGVFALPPWRWAAQDWGRPAGAPLADRAAFSGLGPLPGGALLAVRGRLWGARPRGLLAFIGSGGRVVGEAVVGPPKPGAAGFPFSGYLSSGRGDRAVALADLNGPAFPPGAHARAGSRGTRRSR